MKHGFVSGENDPSVAPTARMLSWARNSTVYRLSRRMMSEHELAIAIRRKARSKFEDISEEQLLALIAVALHCGRKLGGLDDRVYADAKVRSAVRGGKSKRAISRKLLEKGINRQLIDNALGNADDFRAALAYARKRALGPFRRVDADEKRIGREFASLVRNGFEMDLSKQILRMNRDEAEEVLSSHTNWQ